MRAREKCAPEKESFFTEAGVAGTILSYRKSQAVFSQGEPANSVFYIHKGGAKLTVLSGRGKEAVLAILEAGNFFGEGCLAGQRVRMSSVVATIDATSMLRIEDKEMTRALREHRKFCDFFLRHLLSRNIRIEEDLVDQLFNSSEKRLARALLLVAHYGNGGNPETYVPKISQVTLAEMIGTTRERVSFFMNKFRKLGFIEYNGGLRIHNSLLSIVLHD
jgi:CRP/FNR family transcriptional regulator, cyclic AMP receptor protein